MSNNFKYCILLCIYCISLIKGVISGNFTFIVLSFFCSFKTMEIIENMLVYDAFLENIKPRSATYTYMQTIDSMLPLSYFFLFAIIVQFCAIVIL